MGSACLYGVRALTPPHVAASSGSRLMLCDRGKIIEVRVQADGQWQRNEKLALPKPSLCPQWTPKGTGAIVATYQEIPGNPSSGRSTYDVTLKWYDAASASLSDFHHLQDEDGAFEPIWQGELPPPMALVSTRKNPVLCPNQASSLVEKVLCRNAAGDLYVLDPDERLTMLMEHRANQSICRLRPSPDGFWLAVMQGACSSAAYDQAISIFRVDNGERQTVPISPSIHSVVDMMWHPSSDKMLVLTRQTRASPALTDLLVYNQKDQSLTTWVNNMRDYEFAHWRNDALLYVEGTQVRAIQADQMRSSQIGRIPAANLRCIPFFNLSDNLQMLARRDRCERSYSTVYWFDFGSGSAYTTQINFNALGSGAISPDGKWLAVAVWMRGLPGPSITVGKLLLINTATREITEVGDVAVNAKMDWFEGN